MLIQIYRFPPLAGISFGIMTAVVGPMASTEFTIDVSNIVQFPVFGQNQNRRFYDVFIEGCCLPYEFTDIVFVILGEEGRNDVPFGRKFK